MEQSSHKSHLVDVTTTAADVIYHEERLLGQRLGKNLFHLFLPSMSSRVHRRHTRMVPNIAGFIVKPLDFCYVTCVCIRGEMLAIYLLASSCP